MADREFALNIANRLRNSEVNVWIDVIDIPKGSRWDDELEAALDKCGSLVFILSPNSVESQHVKDEVYAIAEKGGYVVPILLKECRIPLRYRRLQRIDFTGDFELAYAATLEALRSNSSKIETPEITSSATEKANAPSPAPSTPDSLVAAFAGISPLSFRNLSVLLEEGCLSNEVFHIVSGSVRIYSTGEKGREFEHERRGPGEFLGEYCLNQSPSPYSAQAIGEVTCHAMEASRLEKYLTTSPTVALALIRTQLKSSSHGIVVGKNLALSDVYTRIKLLLNGAASPYDANGERSITVRLTHSDIATRVGASREMVSRIMQDMARGGYITLHKGEIHLKKVLPQRW